MSKPNSFRLYQAKHVIAFLKFIAITMIFLFFFFKLINLFMAVLGLRFCTRASLVAASGGHSSSRCMDLSLSWPLVAEHWLQTRRLSSCGSRAQLVRGMWDLPRPGLEPVSPALAGRFSTTAPPGKPYHDLLHSVWCWKHVESLFLHFSSLVIKLYWLITTL